MCVRVCDAMQATKDLENYDAERHEEFKRYEMLKEHERREYLKSLDQEKREREEKRMEEMKEKHRQHPKVNAPVSPRELCVTKTTEHIRGFVASLGIVVL